MSNHIHSWGKLLIAIILLVAVSYFGMKELPVPGSLLGIVTGVMLIQALVIFEYEGKK